MFKRFRQIMHRLFVPQHRAPEQIVKRTLGTEPLEKRELRAADVVSSLAGDANGDGSFDQLDIVQVLQAGKYLTGEHATFEEGDFTGDGVFDANDIVAALQQGNYGAASDGPDDDAAIPQKVDPGLIDPEMVDGALLGVGDANDATGCAQITCACTLTCVVTIPDNPAEKLQDEAQIGFEQIAPEAIDGVLLGIPDDGQQADCEVTVQCTVTNCTHTASEDLVDRVGQKVRVGFDVPMNAEMLESVLLGNPDDGDQADCEVTVQCTVTNCTYTAKDDFEGDLGQDVTLGHVDRDIVEGALLGIPDDGVIGDCEVTVQCTVTNCTHTASDDLVEADEVAIREGFGLAHLVEGALLGGPDDGSVEDCKVTVQCTVTNCTHTASDFADQLTDAAQIGFDAVLADLVDGALLGGPDDGSVEDCGVTVQCTETNCTHTASDLLDQFHDEALLGFIDAEAVEGILLGNPDDGNVGDCQVTVQCTVTNCTHTASDLVDQLRDHVKLGFDHAIDGVLLGGPHDGPLEDCEVTVQCTVTNCTHTASDLADELGNEAQIGFDKDIALEGALLGGLNDGVVEDCEVTVQCTETNCTHTASDLADELGNEARVGFDKDIALEGALLGGLNDGVVEDCEVTVQCTETNCTHTASDLTDKLGDEAQLGFHNPAENANRLVNPGALRVGFGPHLKG